MSELEKNSSIIGEIKDKYQYLTEGEPSPDDEIEAQKELVRKFQELQESENFKNKKDLIEEILTGLEEWDSLEQWFIETSLPKKLENFLEIKKEKEQIPEEKAIKVEQKGLESKKISETTETESESETEKIKEEESSKLDVSEIVAQVSEQFKGEIDTLKEKIDSLQKEIKTKEETLQEIRKKKEVKTIKPHKESKLPPLEIHLPAVKKAEEKSMKDAGMESMVSKKRQESAISESQKSKLSDRESKLQKKQQKYKEKLEVSLKQLEAIEKEMEEKIEKEQTVKEEDILETELGTEEKQPSLTEKEEPTIKPEDEVASEYIEESKLEQPSLEPISIEEMEKPERAKAKKEEKEISIEAKTLEEPEEKKLTPIPKSKVEKTAPPPPPKKLQVSSKPPIPPDQKIEPKKSTKASEIPPTPQKESITQKPEEESSIKTAPPKKPKISTMAIEEPIDKEKAKEKSKEKLKKEKAIAEVKVEEVETKTKKPSKTDLFSVFSSVGQKPSQTTEKSKKNETIKTFIPGANKDDKIKKVPLEEHQKNISQVSPEETPDYAQEFESKNIEELPRDKDSLYQELIALEGKRYSIEREYKVLNERYEKGNIGDHEFKTEDRKLKNSLNDITKKITNIRRILSSL